MLARVIFLQLAGLSGVLALPAIPALIEDMNSAAVLVRDKRDPSRSYMFSGFMPGSGMSAFASSADFAPYYPRRPGHGQGWSQGGSYPPEPATQEHPPERGGGEDKPWSGGAQPGDSGKGHGEEEDEDDAVTKPPKKNKKKHKPQQEEDEEEYEKPARGTGGNAAASFNAWFPIMLGMFPSSGYPGQQGGEGFRGAGGAGGYGGREPPASHTTVIANSVSHGRSGVASSHAVAYGGGGGGGGGWGGGGGQNKPQGH